MTFCPRLSIISLVGRARLCSDDLAELCNGSTNDSDSFSPGSNPGSAARFAAMVKRLRRRPLTAKTGVRVPVAVPPMDVSLENKLTSILYFSHPAHPCYFGIIHHTMFSFSHRNPTSDFTMHQLPALYYFAHSTLCTNSSRIPSPSHVKADTLFGIPCQTLILRVNLHQFYLARLSLHTIKAMGVLSILFYTPFALAWCQVRIYMLFPPPKSIHPLIHPAACDAQ